LAVAGKTLTRQVEGGSGYASEAMLPVHFGLGDATRIEWVEITWPDGFVQRFTGEQFDPFIDRVVQIEEGSDRPAEFWGGARGASRRGFDDQRKAQTHWERQASSEGRSLHAAARDLR
jgi:hypothetical protein